MNLVIFIDFATANTVDLTPVLVYLVRFYVTPPSATSIGALKRYRGRYRSSYFENYGFDTILSVYSP